MSIKPTGLSTGLKSARTLILIIFLAASLLGMSLIATAQGDGDAPTFAAPEDAITFYLDALIQGDVAAILQATAVNEMSENFDFERHVNRLRALTIQSPAPSEYSLFVEINKVQFTGQILGQVKNLTYALLATEKDIVAGQFVPIEPEGTTQFRDEVDPARLAGLEIMAIGAPFPDRLNSERNQEIFNELAQIYGADEQTERVVLFQFEGNIYYMGFTLLRYGDDWKISNAAALLGGTSPSGAPEPTTPADFQEMISSE